MVEKNRFIKFIAAAFKFSYYPNRMQFLDKIIIELQRVDV